MQATHQPVGFTLLSDSAAAGKVNPMAEKRSGNATPNARVPTSGELTSFVAAQHANLGTGQARWEAMLAAVTGNFTGTTEEIVQAVAWKWGLHEDLIRAVMQNESNWNMSQVGDLTSNAGLCPPSSSSSWDGVSMPCPRSFGVAQVSWGSEPGTYPLSVNSTAFNLEYWALRIRGLYEANYPWRPAGCVADDMVGAIGAWYSGSWRDPGALLYVQNVEDKFRLRAWLAGGF